MPNLTSQGKAAIWLGVVIFILDILAVLLRLFARRSRRLWLEADDYLIILAIPLEFAYIGLLLWGVIGGGGGNSIYDITAPQLSLLFKAQFITNFFINTICTVVKLSILLFYRRIFDVSKQFRTASTIVGNTCVAWYIVATCFAIIPCQPISAAWIVGPEGPYPRDHCINFPIYFVCIEVTNVFLDILILCLPLQMIRRLHLPGRQRIYLSCIFLLGSLLVFPESYIVLVWVVCIAGLLRVGVVYKPGRNLSLILLTHFSILETGVAIICACLPTYGPLLDHSSHLVDRFKRWYGSQKLFRSTTSAFSGRYSGSNAQFDQLGDVSASKISPHLRIADATGGSRGSGNDSEGHPLVTIP